jgi:GH15 family glucan-1,4-alpha-glucosidase
MEKGWNEDREAFVQHYGSEFLDAANLIMPLVFFMSPNDPRMLKTLDAINKPQTREDWSLIIWFIAITLRKPVMV